MSAYVGNRKWPGESSEQYSERIHRQALMRDPNRITAALRTRVYERDAYRCQMCGDWHNLTLDHVVPQIKGGPSSFENLRTLCGTCNSRKGARDA